MKCPRCAAENNPDYQFCAQCGAPTPQQPHQGQAGWTAPAAPQQGQAGWTAQAPQQPQQGQAGWTGPPAAAHQGQPGWGLQQPGWGTQPPGWGGPPPGQPPGAAGGAARAPGAGTGGYPAQGWPAASVSPRPAAGTDGGRGLSLAAGIVAIAGVVLIIWACALPYVRYSASTSLSVFTSGSPGGVWFAAEPVGVAVVATVAAVLLLAAARLRGIRWLAAGMLVAFGIQTALLFVGYRFGITGNGVHAGIAGIVGVFGGLVVLLAGVLALVSGIVGRSAGDPATPAAATGAWR